jgi:predicted transcriptional regulator YdeE
MKLLNQKAKVGDKIVAYNFKDESGCRSDYYVGVVTEIKADPRDGVEYVHYTATEYVQVERYSGEVEETTAFNHKFRCPQNGTPTTLGENTNNIRVFEECN